MHARTLLAIAGAVAAQEVTLVSGDSLEQPAEGIAFPHQADLSFDGNLFVFESDDPDVVPGAPGGGVFVRDRALGATTCASVDSNGVPSGQRAYEPDMSGDGRFVAFCSGAEDLVAERTNDLGWWPGMDVFVHDRETGETIWASKIDDDKDHGPFWHPSVSDDGRVVAYTWARGALSNGTAIWMFDREQGTTRRVDVNAQGQPGDGGVEEPKVSADGRWILFASTSTNLVPDDANGPFTDVFRYDLESGSISIVSLDDDGGQFPQGVRYLGTSQDGGRVAFYDQAEVSTYSATREVRVHDLRSGTTEVFEPGPEGVLPDGFVYAAIPSEDGAVVAFWSDATNLVPVDTNGEEYDVFLRDVERGLTQLVSRTASGLQPPTASHRPTLSGNGRTLAFSNKLGQFFEPTATGPGYEHLVRDSDPCGARAFCHGPPSTSGLNTNLALAGTLSLATGQLALSVNAGPPHGLGVVLVGTARTELPFGAGLLCLSGTLTRLRPPVLLDGSGAGALSVPLEDLDLPASALTAGGTVYLQLVHRDPGSPGTPLRQSNALKVPICP